MKKLVSKLGESIAETLVAVLILSFAFLILTGAVATAARVNNSYLKNEDVVVGPVSSTVEHGGTVTITLGEGSGAVSATADVTVYTTSGHGYVYYDHPTFSS